LRSCHKRLESVVAQRGERRQQGHFQGCVTQRATTPQYLNAIIFNSLREKLQDLRARRRQRLSPAVNKDVPARAEF
jgi:hypothetical protein